MPPSAGALEGEHLVGGVSRERRGNSWDFEG